MLSVEVADGEGGIVDRTRCIEGRLHRGKPIVEHAGHGEHLEHRTHLVDAEADAIEPVLLKSLLSTIWIEVGKRGQCEHLARMNIHDDAGGGLGAIGGHRSAKLLAQHMLHAEIERDRHAFLG
jgi:hypothetical protein